MNRQEFVKAGKKIITEGDLEAVNQSHFSIVNVYIYKLVLNIFKIIIQVCIIC